MTDTEETTQFATPEGENTQSLDSEKENSAESSTEEKTEATDETQSPAGDGTNTQDEDTDKSTPFHEHPRWKEREQAWDTRFNEQEARHQEDMQKIRDEFSNARKEKAESTEIASWFGGSQADWEAYLADEEKKLQAAEDRALKRLTDTKASEDKAVKEATEYMTAEMAAIETDKELNPKGEKIDPNKLLKFVLDNDLVDSKGRWNYRAGYRMMQGSAPAPKPNTNAPRKEIAGATNSEARAESKPSAFKTSSDFKKPGARPW